MTNVSQKTRPLDFSWKFQWLEFEITNALRKIVFQNLVFCCIKMSSACERQRKQYLDRRIVKLNYWKSKKTRPLSRNRRVSKRVCLTCMFQNPVIQHDDSSIGVAFSLIFYSLSWVLKFMFERVCFVFFNKTQGFETYIHAQRLTYIHAQHGVKLLCMYVWGIHTYTLEGFKHTYIHTYIHAFVQL